jgi:hypothetical protein
LQNFALTWTVVKRTSCVSKVRFSYQSHVVRSRLSYTDFPAACGYINIDFFFVSREIEYKLIATNGREQGDKLPLHAFEFKCITAPSVIKA